MQVKKPKFVDSPYFDSIRFELKKGAPKKIRDEFEAFNRITETPGGPKKQTRKKKGK